MAKCPVCKTVNLEPAQFENSLPILNCGSCGGSWLRANEYSLWLKSQKPGTFDESKAREAGKYFPVSESNKAAICPDCGHLLRKYKVGAKVDFHLDRCNNCNGVWFDNNEWVSLKAGDLHDEINKVFTKPWQQHIDDEMTAGKLDSMYLQKFGESDYRKIKEIREWLQEHPNRNTLIAFLLDKDPFSN
jgi:Zn-finger nucleic acid-binding protein